MRKRNIAVLLGIFIFGSMLFLSNAFGIFDGVVGGTSSFLGSASSGSAGDENQELYGPELTKALDEFSSEFQNATKYTYAGTKRVVGDINSYVMDFSCSVNGSDFAVKTVSNEHTLRQLFVNGQFRLIDDTDQTVTNNESVVGFPETNLLEALNGKVVLVSKAYVTDEHAWCYELYTNGIVYSLYFNTQSEFVRLFYLSGSYEITYDFSSFQIGTVDNTLFSVPSTYTVG